jgi:hypothetical protein
VQFKKIIAHAARKSDLERESPLSLDDGGNTPIGSFGDDSTLRALLKPGEWNSVHIIARGNTIIQVVNGRTMSAIIDEDEQGRALDGLLGLQIHTARR